MWRTWMMGGVMALAATTAGADTYLFDMKNTGAAPNFGGTWNVLPSGTATSTTLSGFVTADNIAADITLHFSSSWDTASTVTQSGWNGGNPKDWVDHRIADDYFHVQANAGLVTVGGLLPNHHYQIEALDARNSSGSRVAHVTVNGLVSNVDRISTNFHAKTHGWDNQDILRWDRAWTNAAGELTLVVEALSSNFGYLNGMMLQTGTGSPVAPAVGTELLIDFSMNFLPASPAAWNIIDSNGAANNNIALRDSAGNTTWAYLSMPEPINRSGASTIGWNTDNPLPDWTPTQAADDYLFFQVSNELEQRQMVLNNLGPDRLYDIEIIASRDFDRPYTVTIGDTTIAWNDGTDGYLNGDTMRFENVLTDTNGQIIITYSDFTAGTGAYNAMRIVAVIPEPATMTLIGLGAILLLGRRRH